MSHLDDLQDFFMKLVLRSDDSAPQILKDNIDNFTIKNSDPMSMPIDLIDYAFVCLSDLRFKLLVNETDTPLVTSDNPSIRQNALADSATSWRSGVGLGSAGLQIFLPLSPQICLIFYDPVTYRIGGQRARPGRVSLTPSDVQHLNALQACNADDILYHDGTLSQNQLVTLKQLAAAHRARPQVDFTEIPSPTDPNSSYVLTGFHRITLPTALSFTRISPQARRFVRRDGAILPRNPLVRELYDEYKASPAAKPGATHIPFIDWIAQGEMKTGPEGAPFKSTLS